MSDDRTPLCQSSKNQISYPNRVPLDSTYLDRIGQPTTPIGFPQSISSKLGEDVVTSTSKTTCHLDFNWNVAFPIVAWDIWSTHNKNIIGGLPFEHCFTSHCLLKQGKPIKTTFFIGWKPLPLGIFKLNTNGFACGNLGNASVGGLIRVCIESWIAGFSRRIHFMVVELWGLCNDVALA